MTKAPRTFLPAEKPIEKVFLESLLKLCLISILVVIGTDIYFTRFAVVRSLIVNSSVLFAILTAFLLYHKGYYRLTVYLTAGIILAAMFYQSIAADTITTSSMAVIMVVGFSFSVLLKKSDLQIAHPLTMVGMTVVFAWLAAHPQRYGKPDASDIIVAGITYGMLYFILAYSAWILKRRYDRALEILARQNSELIEKSYEIEAQNEELLQGQENLSQLNNHLEQKVAERTYQLENQNQRLVRYAFSNAHHLRGPVARLLGLIYLSKLESATDFPELFDKIEEQAKEIDEVIKRINKELE